MTDGDLQVAEDQHLTAGRGAAAVDHVEHRDAGGVELEVIVGEQVEPELGDDGHGQIGALGPPSGEGRRGDERALALEFTALAVERQMHAALRVQELGAAGFRPSSQTCRRRAQTASGAWAA